MKITNKVGFSVSNLTQGNELTNTMRSGEMIINGTKIPFVLQRRVWGKIEISVEKINLVVVYYSDGRKTNFTKAGYVSFQFTTNIFQFYAYIKSEYVKKLTSAISIIEI